MPFLCYDIVFKSVFMDEVNILAKMVSDITGIDLQTISRVTNKSIEEINKIVNE